MLVWRKCGHPHFVYLEGEEPFWTEDLMMTWDKDDHMYWGDFDHDGLMGGLPFWDDCIQAFGCDTTDELLMEYIQLLWEESIERTERLYKFRQIGWCFREPLLVWHEVFQKK